MNELEKQLAEILEKALAVAEQTGEFVIEQAPLLLQEFYRWHIAKYSLGIFLSLVSFVLIYKFSKFMVKRTEDESAILINGLSTFPLITITAFIYKLLFILVAPKLYLIEYFLK